MDHVGLYNAFQINVLVTFLQSTTEHYPAFLFADNKTSSFSSCPDRLHSLMLPRALLSMLTTPRYQMHHNAHIIARPLPLSRSHRQQTWLTLHPHPQPQRPTTPSLTPRIAASTSGRPTHPPRVTLSLRCLSPRPLISTILALMICQRCSYMVRWSRVGISWLDMIIWLGRRESE